MFAIRIGFLDYWEHLSENRTGSSIYRWETEANGGHIGATTWGVHWKENENFDIFYLKLTNEMCWHTN